MTDRLRRLTEAGVSRFRDYLSELRANATLPCPSDLVTAPEFATAVPGRATLERHVFSTKREAAHYLHSVLDPLNLPAIHRDVGLWSWLSLWFFDSVCPIHDSRRKPLAHSHYVLDATDWRRRYRHLLLTPYMILETIPDHNRIFLDSPLSVHGEMIEQTISKLYLFRLPGVRQAIDLLYFDTVRGRPRPGLFSTKKPKPGDLRSRLPTKIKQLQRTYDVAALNGHQLIELLGPEFSSRLGTNPQDMPSRAGSGVQVP